MVIRIALYGALALLMIVSIIELSLVSTMVWYLHHGPHSYTFAYLQSTYLLKSHPQHFLLNQGHTSNGASGTAFILIGIGGFLVLWLRSRRKLIALYYMWLVLNVLSLMLVLGALAYVFTVTTRHDGQQIDPRLAAELDGRAYPVDYWTPQNWFSAVLKLDLTDHGQRNTIKQYLRIMRGWEYNLIPFFVIHFMETLLALWEARVWRKTIRYHRPKVETY